VRLTNSGSQTPRQCPALTFLDRRAIRTAWIPVLAQIPIAAMGLAIAATSGSTVVVIAAADVSLAALALLLVQAHGCRRLSAHRILRADILAAGRIVPYAEYCDWVASLPPPGRAWRALGAPTPQERLQILQEMRVRG